MKKSITLFTYLKALTDLKRLQELKDLKNLSDIFYLVYIACLSGEKISKNTDLTAQKPEKRENCYFTSKELDEETNLYYFGARYLDPQTSRWMSPDPIYDGVREGIGIYTYCRNNPLIYTDPTGLYYEGENYSYNTNDGKKVYTASTPDKPDVTKNSAVNTKVDSSVKRYLNDAGRLDYATKDVAETMQDAAKQYKEETGFDLFCGDFSAEGGVPSERHRSSDNKIWDHKGFSVDLKFGTDDGSSGSGKSYDSEGSNYSATNTVKMLSIIKSCAENHSLSIKYTIFGDSTVYDDKTLSGMNFLKGENRAALLNIHKNHIHVEFRPKPAKK